VEFLCPAVDRTAAEAFERLGIGCRNVGEWRVEHNGADLERAAVRRVTVSAHRGEAFMVFLH